MMICLNAMDGFPCYTQALHLDLLFPLEGEHNKPVYQLLKLNKQKWIDWLCQ